jgi:transcriptional regulator with XRE-family HTH domain|uniref:helix-turn-helix domain-containing protein n=1 Tax=Enterocloster clostridioformis TaxID=1531 RepID=UPI002058ABC7|nr:MAG TPA: Helix-turn-helix XRE-family like protein [Caudoviricetes sp.]
MNQNIGIDHKQIGNRIKEVREQNDYSQAKLAEETDLSVSYISHIENAKRKASLESIVRIVNVLGITVDELLAGVQLHNPTDYQTDIDLLMAECSPDEKRFIFELVKTSIDIMRRNEWHIAKETSNH